MHLHLHQSRTDAHDEFHLYRYPDPKHMADNPAWREEIRYFERYYHLLGEVQSLAQDATNCNSFRQQLDISAAILEVVIDLINLLEENFQEPELGDPEPDDVPGLFQEIADEAGSVHADPQQMLQQAYVFWRAAREAEVALVELGTCTEVTRGYPEMTSTGPTSANMKPSSPRWSGVQEVAETNLPQGAADRLQSFLARVTRLMDEHGALWFAGDKTCPWMHELVEQEGFGDGWSCDSCSRRFPKAARRLGCRECNWDFCMHCSARHKQNVDRIRARLERLKAGVTRALTHLTTKNGEPQKGIVGIVASLLHQHPQDEERKSLESIMLVQAMVDIEHPSYALALTLHELGTVNVEKNKLEVAETFFKESLAIIKRSCAGSELSRKVAVILHELGEVASKQNKLEAAETFFEESLAMERSCAGSEPSLSVGVTLHELGEVNLKQKKLEAAETFFKESLAIKLSCASSKPSHSVAVTLHRLGNVNLEKNKLKAAETFFTESLAMERSFAGSEASRFVAVTFLQIFFKESLAMARSFAGSELSHLVPVTLHELGNVNLKQNKLEAAETFFKESLAMERSCAGSKPSHSVAVTLHRLGNVNLEKNKLEAAETFFKESLAVARSFAGSELSHLVPVTLHELGYVNLKQNKLEAAETFFKESLAMERSCAGSKPSHSVALTLHELGNVSLKQNKLEAAETFFKESLAMERFCGGSEAGRCVAVTLERLGLVSFRKNEFKAAAILFKESLVAHLHCFLFWKRMLLSCLSGMGLGISGTLLLVMGIHRPNDLLGSVFFVRLHALSPSGVR